MNRRQINKMWIMRVKKIMWRVYGKKAGTRKTERMRSAKLFFGIYKRYRNWVKAGHMDDVNRCIYYDKYYSEKGCD